MTEFFFARNYACCCETVVIVIMHFPIYSLGLLFSFRKYKAKKSGVLQRNTMAFRGAYGELSLLRSFVKKGKQKPSLIYYLPS